MSRPTNIGRAELEVLRYVAEHQPATVGEVAKHIASTKGHARTTVLTVMERLREKRYLTRRKIEGVYRYSPRVPVPELLRDIVGDFVETALCGSVTPFVAYLSQKAKLSDEELKELKQLVRELTDQQREGKS